MSINKTSRCFDSSRKTGSRRTRICEKVAEYLKGMDLCQSSNKRSQSRVSPVGYKALEKLLKNTAKRAKLGKDIHFQMFIHGRATELVKKLIEMELDIFMGWVMLEKLVQDELPEY